MLQRLEHHWEESQELEEPEAPEDVEGNAATGVKDSPSVSISFSLSLSRADCWRLRDRKETHTKNKKKKKKKQKRRRRRRKRRRNIDQNYHRRSSTTTNSPHCDNVPHWQLLQILHIFNKKYGTFSQHFIWFFRVSTTFFVHVFVFEKIRDDSTETGRFSKQIRIWRFKNWLIQLFFFLFFFFFKIIIIKSLNSCWNKINQSVPAIFLIGGGK